MSRPPCSFKSRMKHMLTPGPFTPLTPFAYFPPHVLMTGRKADVAEKKSKKESNGEMLIVKCTLLNSFLILAFFPVSPCRNFPGSSLRDNWGTKVISLLSNLLSLHSARHWKVVFYLVLWRHGHEAVRVSCMSWETETSCGNELCLNLCKSLGMAGLAPLCGHRIHLPLCHHQIHSFSFHWVLCTNLRSLLLSVYLAFLR